MTNLAHACSLGLLTDWHVPACLLRDGECLF